MIGVDVVQMLRAIEKNDSALWKKLLEMRDTYGRGRLETFLSSYPFPEIEIAPAIRQDWRQHGGDFTAFASTVIGQDLLAVSGVSNASRLSRKRRFART